MEAAIIAIVLLSFLLALEKWDRRVERREKQTPLISNGAPAKQTLFRKPSEPEEIQPEPDEVDLVGSIQPNSPDEDINA